MTVAYHGVADFATLCPNRYWRLRQPEPVTLDTGLDGLLKEYSEGGVGGQSLT